MTTRRAENVPSYIVSRIGAIQQELEQLKKTLAYQVGANKQKTRLKGLIIFAHHLFHLHSERELILCSLHISSLLVG